MASDRTALLAATQTLTNKTLTSPKINEDVAVTATASEINSVCDGCTATAAEITAVCDANTATAAEITAVCDGCTATAAEINRACDVSTRIVTLTGDITVSEATHDGKTLLLGEVGGDAQLTVTLPAATGSGAIFHFVVSVVNTSNYIIQVTGDDTIDGTIMALADGGDTVVGFEADGTDDTITLNGTTTGGAAIGDWVELRDIATDQYVVSGQITATGNETTPFSAAV
jgi:predicted Fe-S protein YdhL (DUF1289 family)